MRPSVPHGYPELRARLGCPLAPASPRRSMYRLLPWLGIVAGWLGLVALTTIHLGLWLLIPGWLALLAATGEVMYRQLTQEARHHAALACACPACVLLMHTDTPVGPWPGHPPTRAGRATRGGLASGPGVYAVAPEECARLLTSAARRMRIPRPASPGTWLVAVTLERHATRQRAPHSMWARRILAVCAGTGWRPWSAHHRLVFAALAQLARLECVSIAYTPLRAELAAQYAEAVGPVQALRLALAIDEGGAEETGGAHAPGDTSAATRRTHRARAELAAAAGRSR